jgi:low affinity Fe/Cu permease
MSAKASPLLRKGDGPDGRAPPEASAGPRRSNQCAEWVFCRFEAIGVRTKPMRLNAVFCRFSTFVSRLAGRPVAFVLALAFVCGWSIAGPMFHFSDGWQLVVNTGSSIVTLLMVFLIQDTQNRETAAIQAKLNELIQHLNADARYVALERLPQPELEKVVRASETRAREKENATKKADQD